MGAEASKPKPGTKLQVIGAGLPRTGTASFAAALSILLHGPVYHGGTQMLNSGDERHIKAVTEIWRRTPYQTSEDEQIVKRHLAAETEGYAAMVDVPAGQFVGELMELYPDAKVVCTMRDPHAWTKSMEGLLRTAVGPLIDALVYWNPCARFVRPLTDVLERGRWSELYQKEGENWFHARDVWSRHIAYIERTVPKEKLVYFDVRDGWEPLCQALNVRVPDLPFPRINDSKAVEAAAKKQIVLGLFRWSVIVAVVSVILVAAWRWCASTRRT